MKLSKTEVEGTLEELVAFEAKQKALPQAQEEVSNPVNWKVNQLPTVYERFVLKVIQVYFNIGSFTNGDVAKIVSDFVPGYDRKPTADGVSRLAYKGYLDKQGKGIYVLSEKGKIWDGKRRTRETRTENTSGRTGVSDTHTKVKYADTQGLQQVIPFSK